MNGNIVSNNNYELRLAHWNIGGALKHKAAELEAILDSVKPDVLGISETNQLRGDNYTIGSLNYNFVSAFCYCPEKTRLGVFVKKGLTYKVRDDITKLLEIPSVWLEIKGDRKTILVVNIYREHRLWLPKSQRAVSIESDKINNQFSRFRRLVEIWASKLNSYHEVWMLGDFNLDLIKSNII